MNIANALKHLYPNADPFADYSLRDDLNGEGVKIVAWNLGEMPTLDELQAASDAYDAEQAELKIPNSVTMRQARLALLGSGLLNTVNSAIAAIPGVEGDAARIEWEFAQEVRRDSPLVQSLVPTLGMTNAQLDALFTQAATL